MVRRVGQEATREAAIKAACALLLSSRLDRQNAADDIMLKKALKPVVWCYGEHEEAGSTRAASGGRSARLNRRAAGLQEAGARSPPVAQRSGSPPLPGRFLPLREVQTSAGLVQRRSTGTWTRIATRGPLRSGLRAFVDRARSRHGRWRGSLRAGSYPQRIPELVWTFNEMLTIKA